LLFLYVKNDVNSQESQLLVENFRTLFSVAKVLPLGDKTATRISRNAVFLPILVVFLYLCKLIVGMCVLTIIYISNRKWKDVPVTILKKVVSSRWLSPYH
jgi:hypothetical protein